MVFSERGIEYDAAGNLLRLKRTSQGSTANDLTYFYTGHRLWAVTDQADYTTLLAYDEYGNMVVEEGRGRTYTYNILNLTREVRKEGATAVQYTYAYDGSKLLVKNAQGAGRAYAGSFIYRYDNGVSTPECILFAGGVLQYNPATSSFTPSYHITDHLGSVRMVVNGNGNVVEKNDYYPFGERHQRTGYAQSTNRYLFNGKELQTTGELNLLDYGARMYDPLFAKWNTMDPLAENYYHISPYAYVANNPIRLIDPDGMSIDVSKLYRKDKEGNFINPKQILAFEAFMNTEKGQEILGLFASKGQEISGIRFEKDGIYHKNNIDLHIVGDWGIGSDLLQGSTGIKTENGRLTNIIRANNSDDIGDGLSTVAHEIMIHAIQFSKDYIDDGIINNSHAEQYIISYAKQKGKGAASIHHWMDINHYKYSEKYIVPMVTQYYHKNSIRKSKEQIDKIVNDYVP